MELGLFIAAKSSGQMGSASVVERPLAQRDARTFAERTAAYELRRVQLFAQPAQPPHSYPRPGDPLHGLDRFSEQPRVGRDLPRVAQSSGPPRLLPLPLHSIVHSGFRALLWRPHAPHQSLS